MHKKFTRGIICLLTIILILTLALIILKNLFPDAHAETVEKYCEQWDVPHALAMSLIKAESNFNENAVSSANAKGLMQLTDDTFEYCNSSLKITTADIFNPEDNIRAGVWYFSHLLARYDGNTENAVAAYNAGATNVDKWLNDKSCSSDGKNLDRIPFGETKKHVKRIRQYEKIYEFLY